MRSADCRMKRDIVTLTSRISSRKKWGNHSNRSLPPFEWTRQISCFWKNRLQRFRICLDTPRCTHSPEHTKPFAIRCRTPYTSRRTKNTISPPIIILCFRFFVFVLSRLLFYHFLLFFQKTSTKRRFFSLQLIRI